MSNREGLRPGGSGDDRRRIAEPEETDAPNAASLELGRRLRALRRARGMSLAEVEARSGGVWTASAVGAYERGFRNMSVPRLRALATFYGVPIEPLLGEPVGVARQGHGVVFDLERLHEAMPGSALERFTQTIAEARQDFNGRILSVRRGDIPAICAMVGGDPEAVLQALRESGVLIDTSET